MPLLLIVFFLSGASALAYQVIWIRLFGLVFGGTVTSMSVVVAVFMGGLALGSRIIGKIGERVANRVKLYGSLEIVTGVLAFIVFYAISGLSEIVYSLPFEANARSFVGVSSRLILSVMILIVPTMIMGGTLPLLVRAVTTERKKIIGNTSLLYAFNTLGAMTGALLVGVLLVRYLGITATNHLAASVNIIMGVVALVVSPRFRTRPDTEVPEPSDERIVTERGRRFLVTLAITGFVGLTLEMVWMRLMLLVLNNTIYLYTIIITLYLFGLGFGGLMVNKIIPERKRTERTFGILIGAVGITILLGFVFYPLSSKLVSGVLFDFYATFFGLTVLTALVFILLGFVPVFLMGLSFPLGLGLYAHEIKGLSNRVGIIYALNTVGSLFGSILAVFVLIPAIGMKGTVLLCSVLIMIPAMYFLSRRTTNRALLVGTGAVFVLLFIAGTMLDIPHSILQRHLREDEYIEYLDEGAASTVWISDGPRADRKIWMDNLWVSSTSNEGTHALLAHYPVLFHQGTEKVAGIAFGTGQTFGSCLLYPIDRMVCVEIDADIIEACEGRFDEENYGVMNDPRTEIIIDDGRFFLAGTDEMFDVVTAEPLQPYTRGTVNLYSYEFYAACRDVLRPGGVVAQWLPVYNSGVRDTWSMIRTFSEVFSHVRFFMNGSDGILLGSEQPIRIDAGTEVPEMVIRDLARIQNGNVYALTGNYICSRDKLLEVARHYPIISDDQPILEYTAPISHWSEDVEGPIEMRRQFLDLLEPLDDLFIGGYDSEKARRYRESRTLVNRGFIEDETGNPQGAYQYYLEAYQTNPEDLRAIRSLFFFLRAQNRLDLLPNELQQLLQVPNMQ